MRASGIKREEVFIVTKVAPDNLAPGPLARSVKESIGHLRLGEIDLLLLHWPNKGVPLKDTIDALCNVKRDGLARHIGVSNYTVALLDEADKLSEGRLVCNQFECHPFLDQSKVLAACRKHGLAPVAYSPIARGGAKRDATLEAIGKRHGKSAAQVSLRYLVQQGIGVIPRTVKGRAPGGEYRDLRFRIVRRRHGRDRKARASGRPDRGLGLVAAMGPLRRLEQKNQGVKR